MVHPPHWRPMSSAWIPATTIFDAVLLSGSNSFPRPSPFFSSTRLLLTASRASVRWACSPATRERSAMGRSNRPITSFTLRIRRTASSILEIVTWPERTRSSGPILSTPSQSETTKPCSRGQRHHQSR
ncbi:unnamed protein product [Spirodela intermedia]|uniref:Uncharacterized protein n=1 Tax=Spirodela intermedia TaxID=51605 RepID=A0A7I8KWC2_SPIIN|nr:unnamed protein product [Spirodela intermedia]